MRKRQAFVIAWGCVALACAAPARAQTTLTDPAAKLALFGAAFAPKHPLPSPQRVMASAFLPGRGVITWDITGLTAEQAQEAQIEAMGRADAEAVQREIDATNTQARPPLTSEERERQAFAAEAGAQRAALNISDITGSLHDAGGLIPLNRAAKGVSGLVAEEGDTAKKKPRVYAFAAVSGRRVGFNVLQGDDGWKNGGFTTDRDGFVGQRQAGLAWRRGEVQTSLSYVQEKTHTQVLGVETVKDHRVMLSLDLPPQAVMGFLRPKL